MTAEGNVLLYYSNMTFIFHTHFSIVVCSRNVTLSQISLSCMLTLQTGDSK